MDQGVEHGPAASFAVNPKAYDPAYHFQLAIEAGCNAYAAPFGFLAACAREFAGEIPLILKINNSNSLHKQAKKPLSAITSSIEQALKLGCAAVGFTIYPGSETSLLAYESAAQIGEQAREAGLAFVLWSYPRGSSLSKQGETALDIVSYAAHIACQLGAHIIKVKAPSHVIERESEIYQKHKIPTKNLDDRVAHVIQSSFNGRRIVIFSGGANKNTQDLLQEINLLAQGGSFGSIIGRNAFQRPKAEALELLKNIINIYKNFCK